MPHLTRRGFSLVELLIAMVLLTIVTAGLYRTLMTNQRVYQQQTQVIGLQQNMRAAAAILPRELRELDASDSDITAMSAESLSIRAHRWTAVMCIPPATGGPGGGLGLNPLNGVQMAIRLQPFFGRDINTVIDSIFVRYEGDDGTRRDDGWVIGAIVSPVVANASGCPPIGLTPQWGRVMQVNLNFGALQNFPTSIVNGDPVLGFEPVTYALDSVGTDWYVVMATSNGRQPLIGPVLSNGLALAYYDSTGAVTADRTRVARIDITLRALTAQQIRARSGSNSLVRMVDSVVTSVALRNNRRF